jgi:mono/diheme cytochrome c family protein
MALFLFLKVVRRFCLRQFAAIRGWLNDFFALALLCLAIGGHPCWAQTKQGSAANSDKAKELYQQLCQRCHAADGKGDPGTKDVPDFTTRSWHEHKRDSEMIVSILDGKGSVMPSFTGKVSQAQAKELVSYVRAFAPTVPGKQALAPTTSTDFEAQFQKLQKDYDRLQKQLKELTAEEGSEKPAQKSVKKDNDAEGMKETLRAAGVLFRSHCQRCHGEDGKGVAGKLDSPDPPDFTRRAWQDERSNARLLKSILDGKKKGMPAFGKDLNEDQARDLVDYVRAFTPRRANSTKPNKDPGDSPCRHKDQERRIPSERVMTVWR